MFLTYGLIARMFNMLLRVCVGVSEYEPDVVEYWDDVGEYDCKLGESESVYNCDGLVCELSEAVGDLSCDASKVVCDVCCEELFRICGEFTRVLYVLFDSRLFMFGAGGISVYLC